MTSDLGGAVALPTGQPLSLALQGGGSLGAFTWGVLDRLLEEPRFTLDCVSGVSAGAMNAVMLAAGLQVDGAAGARAKLERFWRRASGTAAPTALTQALALSAQMLSPYQFNPFDLNPLRMLLNMELDLERLREKPPFSLLIGATRVRDGTLRLFDSHELTTDVLLASACLPHLHQAITIEGEDYWDGGYAANPPVLPVVERSRSPDLLVIRVVPTRGNAHPRRAEDIRRRLDQLNFNVSLDHDLDAIATLKRLKGDHAFARCNLHVIAAEDMLPDLEAADGMNVDWSFLQMLRDAGRAAAAAWIANPATGRYDRPSPSAQRASSPVRKVG